MKEKINSTVISWGNQITFNNFRRNKMSWQNLQGKRCTKDYHRITCLIRWVFLTLLHLGEIKHHAQLNRLRKLEWKCLKTSLVCLKLSHAKDQIGTQMNTKKKRLYWLIDKKVCNARSSWIKNSVKICVKKSLWTKISSKLNSGLMTLHKL